MSLELVDSLAVRNRPKQFSEIVGNTANIQTITGFLLKGQLPRTFGFFGEPGSGKCIVGDSLISTPKGLKFISNFTNTEGFLEKQIPINTISGIHNTSHVFKQSNTDTIYLETEMGYWIEGTPEHPILVLEPNMKYVWKQLKDITFTDVLVLRNKTIDKNIIDENLEEDIGRFFAILYTFYNPKLYMHWTTDKEFIIKDAQELKEKLYGNISFQDIYNDNTLPMDLLCPVSTNVWNRFYYYISQFNRGIIKFSNESIAKQIQTLFLAIGAITKRVENIVEIFFYRFENILGLFRAYMTQLEGTNKFYERRNELFSIGLLQEVLQDNNTNTDVTNNFYSRVTIIKNDRKADVYDVTEPDTHSFIANGIINHNTTTARLLAMTVNCENIGENIKNKKIEPCLKCNSCKLALKNQHPDIREMNAGGEEGNVDAIRRLLQDIRISPRFNTKVFILDECLPLNTEVLMADGTTKNIKDTLGQKILTYNINTKSIEPNIVEEYGEFEKSNITRLMLEDGTCLYSSAYHKWYDAKTESYSYANTFYGKHVLSWDLNSFEEIEVVEAHSYNKKQKLCDIKVQNNHNFFVKFGNRFILSSNCHQMSNSARQNLLKPLEEPPKHVLWILCTTDPDKLPKAALTRCVKLFYNYPTLIECSKRLWKVCKKEYKEVASIIKPYIKSIAANSNCQMRDSYSVLESIAAEVIANPNLEKEELETKFNNILANLGELTTPSIRFITHALLNKYSLPLSIINELEPTRLNEFLNVLARHAHYASMYFSLKREDALKTLDRKRFYGVNFIRFDKALDQVYDKLSSKGLNSEQMLGRIVSLTSGILDGINKNRLGLLTPDQAVLCGINSYMIQVLANENK